MDFHRFAASPWLVAAAAAVLFMGGVLLLFRDPGHTRPGGRVPTPSVTLESVQAATATTGEDSLLFDPTPLFLPTGLDAARIEKKMGEPGGVLLPFPAKLTFAEAGLGLQLPPAADVPAPAGSLIGEPPQAPFLGLGRGDLAVEALSLRGAFLEVTAAGTGQVVLRQPLEKARPPGSDDWAPVEFLAQVDSAGLVGPLVRSPSGLMDDSGQASAEVEGYFRTYLLQTVRIGQRLDPGFYRICVGP